MSLSKLGYEVADLVVAGWVTAMLVLVGLHRDAIPDSEDVLTRHATIGIAYLAVLRLAARFKLSEVTRAILRTACLYFALPLLFSQLGGIIPAMNARTYERELLAADRAMFGIDPMAAMEGWLHPVAVDVFQAVYASYYAIPLVAGISLFLRRDHAAANALMLAIAIAFTLSWAGYFLVPASSPYVAAANPSIADAFQFTRGVEGAWIGDWIRQWIDAVEQIKLDAFPSAHTAVASVCLTMAWRSHRLLFWWLLPLVSALVFSTVYLRYHYVVDVLAGVVVAAAATLVASWELDRLRARPTGKEEDEKT